MSKKYKGKTCNYCRKKSSTTADHVIAREFFLKQHREALPKVPACEECNNIKSTIEHYLTAVLPFGGQHSDASLNLAMMVPKRLSKNAVLHRELATGLKQGQLYLLDHDGSWNRPMTLPFDHGRLERLFAMIAVGSASYHWHVLLPAGYSALAGVFSNRAADFLNSKLFTMRAAQHLRRTLGGGTFAYEGIQAIDDPNLTVWRFSIYGGVSFTGDSRLRGERASLIVAITGSNSLIQRLMDTIFGTKCRPTVAISST